MGLRRIGRRLSRGFRRLSRLGGGILGKVAKPLSKVLGPVQKILGGILNKIPGLDLLSGMATKFLSGPLGLVSQGVLGPLGGIFGSFGNMGQLTRGVGMLAQTQSFQNPLGVANVAQLAAHAQAQLWSQRQA